MGAQKRKRADIEKKKKDTKECAAPPNKKQRTNDNKWGKKSKAIKKGNIRFFFQLPDFTEEQIQNILLNTTKGMNRPLILFHDNSTDNFFLRYVRNNGNACSRQSIDELFDANSKLLYKYEDWFSQNFLSFGIITDFKNKEMYKEDEFKVNVDSNFKMLSAVVDTLKIKEIIIPSKHPKSKKGKLSHRFCAPKLNKKHLEYIHSKLEQFQAKYMRQFIFTDYQVQFGAVDINHNDLFDKLKEKKKEYRQKQRRIKDQEINDKKRNKHKPKLVLQPTQRIEDEKVDNITDITHSVQRNQPQHINHTYNECQHTKLLMERVMQQHRMIMHQQTELRLTKQAMRHYNMERVAMRRNTMGNKRCDILDIVATALSIIVVFSIVGLVVFLSPNISNWAVFALLLLFSVVYYVFSQRKSINKRGYGRRERFVAFLCKIGIGMGITMIFVVLEHLTPSIAHIIDIDDVNDDDDDGILYNTELIDVFSNLLWYLCVGISWFIVVFILSKRISRRPISAFIAISIGGPLMYVSMHLASRIISKCYGNNENMSNEERLQILWWFISYYLLPTVMIAVFIGYLIQIASKSQFRYIINWKSVGTLVLGMVVFYTMIYHLMLTFYAFVSFGFLYIVLQCFTVSGVHIGNRREDTSRTYLNNPYVM